MRLSAIGCRISVVGFQLSDIGFRLSVVGFQLSVVGFQLSDFSRCKKRKLIADDNRPPKADVR
ncbi:hypothetical protein J2Y47_004495 [Arcicella sp. BE51]|nr:hypothetical protein [Arcicella sp. BE51]